MKRLFYLLSFISLFSLALSQVDLLISVDPNTLDDPLDTTLKIIENSPIPELPTDVTYVYVKDDKEDSGTSTEEITWNAETNENSFQVSGRPKPTQQSSTEAIISNIEAEVGDPLSIYESESELDTSGNDPEPIKEWVEETNYVPEEEGRVDDPLEINESFSQSESSVDDPSPTEEWNTEAPNYIPPQESAVDDPEASEEWNTEAPNYIPPQESQVDEPAPSEESSVDNPEPSEEWNTEAPNYIPPQESQVDEPAPSEESSVDDPATSEEWSTEANNSISPEEFAVDDPSPSEEWNTEASNYVPTKESVIDDPEINEEEEEEEKADLGVSGIAKEMRLSRDV